MALKDIVLKLIIDGKESLVTLDKLDNKMLGVGKAVRNVAGAMGLAFGATEVIGFMKDSIAYTQRYNEVTGKLNATLKSTNYAAGMMSDELIDLAGNLEEINRFKFDDKDIIDAEGLLLTFNKINKDIFPETMQLALDMSVRFEQELKPSIIQIGKALQDPEKGVTALTKVGVTFTDQQRELIKELVKENDLLGAQKIIMAELSSQVSGSAAASVDDYTLRINQLNEALEGVQSTLGQILTYGATGIFDVLEGLMKTGSLDNAMIYAKMKEQQSKWKPSTEADYLSEARNSAKNQISGMSDADIRKLIAKNKAMYNASFSGIDEFGKPIDTEGTLAMLDAKLGVYESALIKSDDKITEHKKSNVDDYWKTVEAAEEKYLEWANREAVPNKQRVSFNKSIAKGTGGKQEIKTADELFDEMNTSGKVAINGLMNLSDTFWDRFIVGGRQAKDGWDALWLSFRNSALQQLGEILQSELFSQLVGEKSGTSSGSSGSFLDTLWDIGKVVLPFLDEGGVVTRPTVAMIGEKRSEAIIPLDKFDRGFGSGAIENKLDQVIKAFQDKQFAISMQEFRTVNKRIDDIENSLLVK